MKYCNKALLCLTLCLFVLIGTSCGISNKMVDYYLNRNNYIEVSGTITHIVFNEEKETLYLGFSELSKKLDDTSFKIVGDSYSIVVTYKETIQIGKVATFVTAPKYFGDGYVMPIVSLTIDDNEILSYETGFSNFIDWLK